MTRSFLYSLCFIAALLVAHPSLSLVDPVPSALPPQPWLAQIYVDDGGPALKEFCKGALISAQWVLTTGYCLDDPFEALGPQREEAGKKYIVKFFGSSGYYEVEKFVKSEDFAAALMKLKNPVALQPVRVSTLTEAELRETDVFILGTESTEAVGDIYYNPNLGKRMYCKVDGEVFYRPGAMCYIMPKLTRASALFETRATVVDPAAANAPSSAADRELPFDTSGKRMYLDFRTDASYPCHEDLGAPVLRMSAAGTVELVGVVSGVGMASYSFPPLCNPTLQNHFGTAAAYQGFIDRTVAQETFNSLCPAKPVLRSTYPGGGRVRLSWDAVPGATGYRLLDTTGIGHIPFAARDLGNITETTLDIDARYLYRMVLVAYNSICASPASEQEIVYL